MHEYTDLFLRSLQDYGGYLYREISAPGWHNYFYWLIAISLAFWLLEILWPWRRQQAIIRRDFWLDGFYMFFNFFLFSLIGYHAISKVLVHAFNNLLLSAGVRNLVAIEIQTWAVWAQLLTLFLVRDFVQYWIHRLLHRFEILWEFHKVHHSVEEMGFAAHLRFHWMETVVYRTLEYIPLAMIGFGIRDFFLVHIFTLTVGHWNHANIAPRLGWFRYLFNHPQMHIWHHAKELPQAHMRGVNFGLTLSVWDYLFRTAYIPYDGRDIPLGFEGVEQFPSGLGAQLIYPLGGTKGGQIETRPSESQEEVEQ